MNDAPANTAPASDDELTRRVDAAARSVEGVIRLYSAVPIAARLARRIGQGDEAAPLATLDRSDDRLLVTVHLGVSAATPAGATAARVAEAVHAELSSEAQGQQVRVHVRVSRVTDPRPV